MDIEKVIKGLEECVGNGNCMKCQYGKEKQALSCKKLLADALSLLKEQEPKPIEYIDNFRTGLPIARCPKCGKSARQFHSTTMEETHYCPWCGQAVKWK